MAKIIGRLTSEKEILRECLEGVQSVEEIGENYRSYNNQLEDKKKDFYDRLPARREKEKEKLDEIRIRKEKKIQEYENKIREIKDKAKKHKENKKWFSVISNHLQIFFQKYISKPLNVRKIKKSEDKQKENLDRWRKKPEKIFNQRHYDLIDRINHLDNIMEDTMYAGAQGEKEVLNELSKLNDSYRILCGLDIELEDWISYDGKRKLKSAQMDLVVVSPKGVFVIEVKNWSNQHSRKNDDLSPHEQLDRAGKVLYVYLKSQLKKRIPLLQKKVPLHGYRLTKVLLPIKNNISYDQNYKHVLISSVSKINGFITNREDVFDERQVKRIKKTLQPFVTE